MNFQNFYILISKKNCIKSKLFVILFFLLIFFILIFSIFLKYLDLNMNSNDLIKNYQLEKIKYLKTNNIDTIVIGDSSSGNAINAKLLSKVSGLNAENLSLTGSWGILGSLGILKNVYARNPNLKNIIIIQTLDIWNRPFANSSIHEFFSFNERINYLGFKSIVNNEVNVKEIKWLYEYILRKLKNKHFDVIDYKNDYLKQKKKKKYDEFSSLKNTSADKLKELKMLDEFCSLKELNCIYLNGPMHENVINKSNEFFKQFKFNTDAIKYVDKVFSYNNDFIGDSKDHILPKYKNQVTLDYYMEVKDLLRK